MKFGNKDVCRAGIGTQIAQGYPLTQWLNSFKIHAQTDLLRMRVGNTIVIIISSLVF